MIRTYYLQYILHIGCPENVHFFIPKGTKNACGRACCHFCAPQTPLLGSVLTKKWREWGPLDDQMRPKASKIHPKMHLKTTPNDTWEDRVSLRVRRVPAPCQKYLKLYKKTGKRVQLTYIYFCGGSSKEAFVKPFSFVKNQWTAAVWAKPTWIIYILWIVHHNWYCRDCPS